MAAISIASRDRETTLRDLEAPLDLDGLVPGGGPWEVEIGFGKGRFLLAQAAANPERRYLGIEVASQYFRLVRQRAAKRGIGNLLLMRGEALYILSAILPTRFADTVHVYFPDPWPKARHHERRLFDAETVDLVLGLIRPGGRLLFASDFLEYAGVVAELFDSHPALSRQVMDGPWDGEPRTNYEAKYILEGRPIARFEVSLSGSRDEDRVHPRARRELQVARPRISATGESA